MQINSEAQFHIQEAINHLRQAGNSVLKQPPTEGLLHFQPNEIAGNGLLELADQLSEVVKNGKTSDSEA